MKHNTSKNTHKSTTTTTNTFVANFFPLKVLVIKS